MSDGSGSQSQLSRHIIECSISVDLCHYCSTQNQSRRWPLQTEVVMKYRIARKFGGELNLVVWWFGGLAVLLATAKLKSANISYLHIYVWRSLTKPPNLNPPIFYNSDLGPDRQI